MNIDNMFSCQSFLYLSKKATRALDNIPASGFISIHDTEALRKIAKYIGHEEIEGAILLDYYDQHILTLHEWDYIDVLWNNMAESVDECLHTGEAVCRFWGCPCEIHLIAHENNFIKVYTNWNKKNYWLPKKEFFTTILLGANEFFRCLSSPPWQHRTYEPTISHNFDIMGKVAKYGDSRWRDGQDNL